MTRRCALVAGALGVVGRATLRHLEASADWDVIGLSRRVPDFPTARFIQLDLTEGSAAADALADLADVTHVFFCAYAPRNTMEAEVVANLAMLRHLMAGLEPVARDLAHVQLVHGSKWYGCHLGPYPTPAREDDPRPDFPCFYFDQQDWLEDRQRGRPWTWSAVRPHGICGFAVASPISQLTILAAFGSIAVHLGRPLRFPGKPGAFGALYQTTEARYLAEVMAWIASRPQCANEAYNVTNGDLFRWERLWPDVAGFFGTSPGPVETLDLAAFFAEHAGTWEAIKARHGLRDYSLAELANGDFANWLYGTDYDIVSSTTKLRQAGWPGLVDSLEMYPRLLGELREARIIP